MASEEHKKLATTIKTIHSQLRALSASVGPEEAWRQHLNDQVTLKTYAKSMRELSEKHWKRNASKEDRINWTTSFCDEHFNPAELGKWRQKELRTIEHMRTEGIDIEDPSTELVSTGGKLKVLDVGSSGNFFKKHDRFDVLPIDISPSDDSVFYCDFLSVPITDSLLKTDQSVQEVPKCHFNVVIFCLLLEYLPSSDMRVKCCEKAYQSLQPEGILIIITPDSNHETKNSKQLKNWRWTLAQIGFQRIKVEKLKNLSCMAFRKCLLPAVSKRWANSHREAYMQFKLEIPQDKNKSDKTSDDSERPPEFSIAQ